MSAGLQLVYQRVVALLLLLEAVSVYYLWSLNPVGSTDEGLFAIFLALNLVAFSMISYVYRKAKLGEEASRLFLLMGCCMLLVLLFAGFLA